MMFFNLFFALKIFVFQAAAAKAADGQLAAAHLIAGAIGYFLTQGVGDQDLMEIGNSITFFANEVAARVDRQLC